MPLEGRSAANSRSSPVRDTTLAAMRFFICPLLIPRKRRHIIARPVPSPGTCNGEPRRKRTLAGQGPESRLIRRFPALRAWPVRAAPMDAAGSGHRGMHPSGADTSHCMAGQIPMTTRNLLLAFVIAGAALAHGPLQAATWHVSTAGDDSRGDGSAQRPFRTLGRVLNTSDGVAGAGDTLVLAGPPGNNRYDECDVRLRMPLT